MTRLDHPPHRAGVTITGRPGRAGLSSIGTRPDPAAVPASGAGLVNVANGLTMLRLALVPVFLALLVAPGREDHASRIAAFVVFAAASATDRVDGDLARRRGLVTDFGKVADPLADKALTGAALLALSGLGLLPWWVTGLVLARELGVTALRFTVIRHGIIPASRGGKVKTFVQAVAIGLYVLPLSGPFGTLRAAVMALAVVLTLATGFDYVLRAAAVRRAAPAGGAR